MPRKTLAERAQRAPGRSATFADAVIAARSFEELHLAASVPGGGFTRHLVTGKDVSTGILVSQAGHELSIPSAAPTDEHTLVGYARDNRSALTAPSQYFGGWRAPSGKLVLDVTRRYGTKKAGKRAMVRNNQEAAYNPQSGQEILNPFHKENAGKKAKETGYYEAPTPRKRRAGAWK